ncbi:MAG TPA: fatty acid--CoA ligase family protein [Verrucomicrobiae bacterium]|nr:fatty acid--CoA ligase family protein [Verrucomicrobiae bacterium]
MLYEKWRQVVRARANELALVDPATGRRWTFAQLSAWEEAGELPAIPWACPQGIVPEFIVTVLRAWRVGRVVCPLEAGQSTPVLPPPPPGCVHLKSTSATTGNARCVAFTAGQLAADAENIVATMGLRSDSPNLGVISLSHSYGFSNLILPLLLHGIPLHLAESPLPEPMRQALSQSRQWTVPAVPALWRTWHEAGILSPAIRLAISAGAPLPLPLEQSVWDQNSLKLHNFYGATECGGIAYDRTGIPRADAAVVGTALDGVQLSIGPEGCLEVAGAAVGMTYWPEPRATLAERCYRTSDRVELRDGTVRLLGRASDQINVAGRKLAPESVEQVLAAHPSVAECLVFGVPAMTAERTEVIVACVANRHPTPIEELRNFLLARLPAWQTPKEWWLVDSLETTSRGKLSRAAWRERYLARREKS